MKAPDKDQKRVHDSDSYALNFVGKYVELISGMDGKNKAECVEITFYPYNNDKTEVIRRSAKTQILAFRKALKAAIDFTDKHWKDYGDSECYEGLK